MSFFFEFINVASIALLVFLFFFALRHLASATTPSLLALTLFALLWALGSFAELLAADLGAKIFWRDLTQVGSFFVPAAALIFALAYSGVASRTIRLVTSILYPVQAVPVVLIATDEFHHLMRAYRNLYIGPTGLASLSVVSTPLGYLFLSINFTLVAASLVVMLHFIRRVARPMRKQLGVVAFGMAFPMVYAILRVALGETFGFGLPISSAFAFGCLILLIGVYKFDFLSLEPIARERVFDVIDEGIIVRTADGGIVDINQAGLRMLLSHIPDQGSDGLGSLRRIENLLRKQVDKNARIEAPGVVSFSLEGDGNRGRNYYSLKTHDLCNSLGRRIGSVGVLRDISREVLQIEDLKLRAERDGLTGLYNREAFVELFDGLRHLKPGPSCLIVFDIDDFKRLNDSHGHLAGDMVLKAVCDCCKEQLGADDIFGRIGGDEFVVFLPERDGNSARRLATSLVECVEGYELSYEGHAIGATISAGATTLGQDGGEGSGEGFVDAFARADRALYEAKAGGKKRIAWSDFGSGHRS
jgi:diguanylate cyclase (GGDEF)-like protein